MITVKAYLDYVIDFNKSKATKTTVINETIWYDRFSNKPVKDKFSDAVFNRLVHKINDGSATQQLINGLCGQITGLKDKLSKVTPTG